MICIIDYGAGNLASVQNLVDSLGYEIEKASHANDIPPQSSTIILPGVGDGAYMMQELQKRAFVSYLRNWLGDGRPLLGICVGAQVLLSFTEEGNASCLDFIAGTCKAFKGRLITTRKETKAEGQYKIPHIGWNQVWQAEPVSDSIDGNAEGNTNTNTEPAQKIFSNIPNGANFYFVHSYYLQSEVRTHALATTNYGIEFDSIIGKSNAIGTQFHPEKSGKWGRILFTNFLQYYGKEQPCKTPMLKDTPIVK